MMEYDYSPEAYERYMATQTHSRPSYSQLHSQTHSRSKSVSCSHPQERPPTMEIIQVIGHVPTRNPVRDHMQQGPIPSCSPLTPVPTLMLYTIPRINIS